MLIACDQIWRDGALHSGKAIETDGACILSVRDLGADHPDLRVRVLMPAPIDLQVNGGGGGMLNSAPTLATMQTMAEAHARCGTGAILPTVITDAPEVMEEAAEAALAAKGDPRLLGLHIEGPHINPARRGTHKAAHIRPLDARSMAVLRRLRGADIPVLLTLAPECCTERQIREIAALGVIVSAGHSAADFAQTQSAIAAGVGMFTHLFNAMPPMQSRDPGIVAAAILSDLPVGIIADGIHVHWPMLRLALAARPRKGRMFLVSDAMATVGGPDHFELYGQTITVRDGALVNAEGSLAGAHIDMLTSLARLHRDGGVPLADAIEMAVDAPRRALGIPAASVREGMLLRETAALDEALSMVPFGVSANA